MDATTTRGSPGILSSVRLLADNLLATVHDRVELIALELQEEKFRLIQTFIWISAAIFSAMMALTFASITVVYFFWENARIAALGGLALFYLAVLGALIVGFRRYIKRQPKPFAGTLQELKADRTCIRMEN
jgi:uncharacterized membrane protein YqjE